MSEVETHDLVVRFERLGRDAKTITAYSLQSDYLTATDGFEFTYYTEPRSDLLGLELEPVELLIGGNSQVLGRIDQTEIGNSGSAIVCRGRDYLGDATECNIDPAFGVKKGELLGAVVEDAMAPVGIDTTFLDSDVAMRDVRTGKPAGGRADKDFKTLKQEELKAQSGESIMQFANRLVSRHGATLQPGPTRNSIVITEPNYSQSPVATITRTDDQRTSVANNVIRGTATRDYSSVPTYALWHGKGGKAGTQKESNTITIPIQDLVAGISTELIDAFEGTAVRGRRKPAESTKLEIGQLYRLLYDRDDESRNRDQLIRAATRGMGVRLKETLTYSVTLQGHSDPVTGAYWAVDTVVQVNDDICGLNEPLWVASRTFKYSATEGATTDLELWRPGTFVI
jgi:prophage tail gpP-like protein